MRSVLLFKSNLTTMLELSMAVFLPDVTVLS